MFPRRFTTTFLLLISLTFYVGSPRCAFAAQINFDDVPNGTVIDNAYPGVTFGCVACGSGHAYARDMNAFGSSAAATEPNVITLIGSPGSADTNASSVTSFNAKYGAVTVFFATPQRTVRVQARPQLPLEYFGQGLNKPFLEAYSSTVQNSSTFLGRVLYPLNYGSGGYCDTQGGGCGGPWQTLTFTSSSDNILSLRLSSQQSQGGPNVFADFDNLVFEVTPAPVLAQPEVTYCTNFNSGIPAGMSLFGSATVNGGFLHLTDASGGLGVAYINDFNGGQRVTAFQATFIAALFGSTCCGGGAFPADGFSFNLAPAASTPATPDLTQAVEEGVGQGLTVSFDTWDNGGGDDAPAIDVKWQGQIVAHAPFQASQSPIGAPDAASASRQVVINLDDDGTIDVSYGGVVVFNNVQTPYNPGIIGAPKWIFGARTGLATDNHWIDDLCITARSGGKLCNNFGPRVPPVGLTLFGGAKMDASLLKLLTLPNDSFGIAYFDDVTGGQFVKAFRATFKAALFGSTCCGGGAFPADGFSFNLVPAATVLPNPGYNEPAEEGLDEGLSVTFDTWDNGAGEAPAIGVKWKGQFVTEVPFQASQSPNGATDFASAARDVVIELKANGRIDVSYGGTLVVNNVQTPYDPAGVGVPKWVMGARVGGANDNYWFDDVCITTLTAPGHQIPDLYNTGVDASSKALPDNIRDSHYLWVQGATNPYAATAAGGFPIPPWLGDSTLSAWISPTLDTVAASDGTGNVRYNYKTTFDLTGFNPATARLSGRWATDNNGVDIILNGVSSGQVNTAQFGAWTPFQITSGFLAGTNELTFVVANGSPGGAPGSDPTGLRAELWGMASLDCGSVRFSARIGFSQQNGNLVLTWSQPGLILESAQNVTGPWLPLTRGSSVNGRDFTATLSTTGPARFFRLRLDCP